jgi:peptide alpha-N-acetyltransferase
LATVLLHGNLVFLNSLTSPNTSKLKDPIYPHPIGIIVCKLEPHNSGALRGYIAMLAISSSHRKRGLGTILVEKVIERLKEAGAHEVVLETEEDNGASLRLYRRLGFVRTKHLHRYYLNGKGAFRLVRVLRDRVADWNEGGMGEGIGDERIRREMGIMRNEQEDERDAEYYS